MEMVHQYTHIDDILTTGGAVDHLYSGVARQQCVLSSSQRIQHHIFLLYFDPSLLIIEISLELQYCSTL
jgi:hypothetical protein